VQVSRPDGAWRRAAIFVGDTIRTQPMIMGYPDRFSLLGVVMIAAILSVALLQNGTASGGGTH
jgi:hypothetical protein